MGSQSTQEFSAFTGILVLGILFRLYVKLGLRGASVVQPINVRAGEGRGRAIEGLDVDIAVGKTHTS